MLRAYPIMGEIMLFLLASIALFTYYFVTRHTTAPRVVLIRFVSGLIFAKQIFVIAFLTIRKPITVPDFFY